ncbi:MAG: hypothetical protein HDKAJFGB_00934 [Anaerolineae bacterium]|nr:hypothetical protein [Anaerolineae bacterium]
MSEELNPQVENVNQETATLTETPMIAPTSSEMAAPAAPPAPASKPAWRMLVAPAWFLLGVLVGLGIFYGLTLYTAKPAPPPAATLDEATVKKAAREGLIEAIQALQAQGQQGQGSQGPQTVDRSAFTIRPANQLGNPEAPLQIVEFADFQCPFCGRHHQLVAPELIKNYVDTGKATYVYKHLAFLGNESVWAAIAAECAADQGKFWEYHNYLFEHQNGENQGAFNKDKLIGFGKELGLDMPKFETCVNTDATFDRVRADTEEGQKLGVTSTPTFFVNGKPLVGLTSPDEFKQTLDQALSK